MLFLCIFLPKNKKSVSFDLNDYDGLKNALKTKRTVPTTETVLEKQMKIEAGSEALQQIAQSQEGLVDHVDIVDDGACTGEDAGNGVEHLTDIQEAVVSVAGTTVQIDHFLFADGGIVCGQFHSRHGDFPFY